MKNTLFALAACILIAAAICPAFAQEGGPGLAYFTKQRMDYSQRPDFNPDWKSDPDKQAVLTAYKAKDYLKVADTSEVWLEKNPVDAEVHYMRSQALVSLGDITHYAYELYFFYGLIHSIASSGNGLTEKTAFKVISPDEEYYLLGDFGAQPVAQTVQGNCNVLHCKLPSGKEIDYYFDTTIPSAADARLAPKK